MRLDVKMALSYLSGRKTRTALTTLAIVFGVMVIFGLNGIIPTMQEAFLHGMQSAGDGVDMAITSSSRNMMDISDMAKVKAVNGVVTTTGVLEKRILLPKE